ncbi:MAG: BamA/TamA family outer membrane protein [Acidobacteriota bacterium]
MKPQVPKLLVLSVIGSLVLAAPLAQGTPPPIDESELSRQELWARLREEKRSRVTPGKLSGFESRMLWLEKGGLREILNFNYRNFYPRFATLSTGSGFAPGVRYWKPSLGGSPLDLQASAAWSFRGYQTYSFQFGQIQRRGQIFSLEPVGAGAAGQFDEMQPKEAGFFAYADLNYRNYPQEDFFGIGPDSRREDRTDYRLEDMSYDVVGGWQINRWLGAGIRAGYLQVNIDPGTDRRFPNTQDLFSDVSAPGLVTQPDFFDVSGAVMLDYRDRPGNPHKGGMVGLYISRLDERFGGAYDFNRLAVDIRQFIPLFSEQRTLALQLYGSADIPDAGAQVPFYMMPTLGGSESLRGFREFRFRDKRILYFSSEYRWEASPAIEFAAFYDTGKVFGDRSGFSFEHLQKSFGGGLRLKTPKAVVMRFDVGRSREGTRFFFKFGPAF